MEIVIPDEILVGIAAIESAISGVGRVGIGPMVHLSPWIEERLLAPSILRETDSDALDVGSCTFTSPGIKHGPVKIEPNRLGRIPLIDISASTSGRIPHWEHGELASDLQRAARVSSYYDTLRRTLCNSANKHVTKFLVDVAENVNDQVIPITNENAIRSRIDLGWKLILPIARDGIYSIERHFPAHVKGQEQPKSHYLDEDMALLVAPGLGVWRVGEKAPVFRAWANGENETYGISGYLLRGLAVLNGRSIIRVDLQGAEEVCH